MASPIERYRKRALPALPEHRPEPGIPEYTGNGLVTAAEGKRAAETLGIPLDEATRIILHPPGEKPWPYRHFTKDQVREIGAIVSEWLKVKLVTIQTDTVDQLLSHNRALVERVEELTKANQDLAKRVAKLEPEK